MTAENKTKRSLKDWIIATRPWSFPASFISILVTMAYLYYYYKTYPIEMEIVAPTGIKWLNGWLSLLMIILFHAAGNLISDYFDHIKGVDKPGSLNGVTHIQSGKFTPKGVLWYGIVFLILACIMGAIILSLSSWNLFFIAIAAILLTVCYPWLKAHALGDLNILLCFALIPSLGVNLVVTGSWYLAKEVMLLSLTYGLIIVAILHSNNTRDIESDKEAGLTTLAGILGKRVCQYIYCAELIIPYLLVLTYISMGWISWVTIFVLVTLPLAYKNISIMMKQSPEYEKEKAILDKSTAQFELVFGVLLAILLVVGIWC